MGIAGSHEFTNTCDIDEIDLTALREAWEKLPYETQTKILQKLGLRRRQDRSWKKYTTSKSPLLLEEEIQSHIPKWKINPASFFDQTPIGNISSGDYVFSLYSYLRQLDSQEVLTPIQQRIALVALHELSEAYGRQPDEYFVPHIMRVAEQENCPSDESDVKQRWQDMANRGRRYASIAADLGSTDVLLVLPNDIPVSQ